MSLREVWINGVSDDHEVDATLIWTKTDVDRNSRVGLFQVNSSKGASRYDVRKILGFDDPSYPCLHLDVFFIPPFLPCQMRTSYLDAP